jgi:putative addiction module component (TIGR02574 family)
MSINDTLLHQVLALAPGERAEFARQILLSLDEDAPDPEAEDAWAMEIEARLARVPEGDAPAGSDWREAIERVRQSLKPGPRR